MHLENLKEFISEFAGIKKDRIMENSSIKNDLRITGTDAIELILAYGKKFNVDVSNFMAADYFEGEGHDDFGEIIRFFTRKKVLPKKNLTVGHLMKGISMGKLDEMR